MISTDKTGFKAHIHISAEIHAHLSTPVPAQLWHYTSMKAMQAIIDQGVIYATDARFQNDRDELIHAAKYADSLIKAEPRHEEIIEFVRRHVATLFDELLSLQSPYQNYLTCFSSRKDDLSQWRAYSKASAGASLGFDLRNFISIAPCIYKDEDKRKFLISAFRTTFDVAEMLYRNDPKHLLLPGEELTPDMRAKFPMVEPLVRGARSTFLPALMILMPLFKDASFEAESEWRIVALSRYPEIKTPGATEDDDVFYLPRADTLVPTASINLKNDTGLPLTGLVLGPGSHPYAHDAANRFLRSKGFSLEAEVSSVPYRSTSTF